MAKAKTKRMIKKGVTNNRYTNIIDEQDIRIMWQKLELVCSKVS